MGCVVWNGLGRIALRFLHTNTKGCHHLDCVAAHPFSSWPFPSPTNHNPPVRLSPWSRHVPCFVPAMPPPSAGCGTGSCCRLLRRGRWAGCQPSTTSARSCASFSSGRCSCGRRYSYSRCSHSHCSYSHCRRRRWRRRGGGEAGCQRQGSREEGKVERRNGMPEAQGPVRGQAPAGPHAPTHSPGTASDLWPVGHDPRDHDLGWCIYPISHQTPPVGWQQQRQQCTEQQYSSRQPGGMLQCYCCWSPPVDLGGATAKPEPT